MTTYAGLYGPEALIDSSGHAITSAVIDVFTHGTTTHVSLYQDNARGTPLSNPVPNGVDGSTAGRGLDTFGNLSFYVDPGRYDLRIATGAGTRIVEIEVETDPAETAASGGSGAGGLYLPSDWGQFWKPKVAAAKAGTGQAVVAAVGDSVTRGYFSSDLTTKSWFGLLVAAMQSAAGDGGSGFQGVQDLKIGDEGGATPNNGYANCPSVTGTWTYYTANQAATVYRGATGVSVPDGPGGSFVSNTASNNAIGPFIAGTLTFTRVRGTVVRVYYANNSAAFTVTVDGGSPVTVTPTGTAVIAHTDLTVAAGSHTVVLSTTTTSAAIFIYGVGGINPGVGVLGKNYARQSFGSGAMVTASPIFGSAAAWSGGQSDQEPADLAIWSFGLNDSHGPIVGTQVTADGLALNFRNWAAQVREAGAKNGAVDLLVVIQHPGTWESSPIFHAYAQRLFGIAAHYGAAVLDMGAIMRNNYAYGTAASYWSNSTSAGTPGSDAVHPGDIGHQLIKDTLVAKIPALLG